MKWGLIGASNIAKEWIIGAVNGHPGCSVKTVFGTDQARTKAYAAQSGIANATSNLDELLSDREIEAVYVSTTNDRHAKEVIAAAKAGKHILCEKPIALTIKDAEDMIEACKKAGVVLAVNHHIRNHESHRAIKGLIKAGEIGDVNSIRMFFAVNLPPELRTWRLHNKAQGAGAILDLTVHEADTLRFYLDANPQRVTSMAVTAAEGSKDVEDSVMSVWQFPGNVLAFSHDSLVVPYAGNGVEIHGTLGSIFAPETLWQHPLGRVFVRTQNGEREIAFEKKIPYHRTISEFVAAVKGKGSPSASGVDGLWSLKCGLAVMKSAEIGAAVEIK